LTPVLKKNQNPSFMQKLLFPVTMPMYNDRIVVRMWDKRTGQGDDFIANIPEFPKENDFFSVNYLHAKGGTMKYT